MQVMDDCLSVRHKLSKSLHKLWIFLRLNNTFLVLTSIQQKILYRSRKSCYEGHFKYEYQMVNKILSAINFCECNFWFIKILSAITTNQC